MVVFLFNQKTAYDMRISDWSSDVCSSDLIAVIPFDHADEAAALANDVAFGLSASIFTENINQAHATALALRVGTVWVNTRSEERRVEKECVIRVDLGGRRISKNK